MTFSRLETIMFRNSRWLVAVIVLASFSNCTFIAREYGHRIELQHQWDLAASLEESKQYAEAAKEYGRIAETFPTSFVYEKAVRKAAMLSVDPENRQFDLDAGLKWFKVLAELPIPPAEQENVRLHIALLERIKGLQNSISELDYGKKKLMTVSAAQEKELAERDRKIRELESELAWTSEELKKMKEVDVLLHESRKKK
jgi:hypothetical protein